MYTRPLLPQAKTPIQDGKPVQGTWTSPFETVDLTAINNPYRIPLPRILVNYRIKEWQSFIVQNDNIWMAVLIGNVKAFCFAKIIFIDRQTKKKMRVFRAFPSFAWNLPQSLYNDAVDYESPGFSFRVQNSLSTQLVRIDLTIDAAMKRPAFTARLEFDLNIQKTTPMAVNLLISDTRPLYIYKGLSEVRGNIRWGDSNTELDPSKTTGLFRDGKAFFPFASTYLNCCCFGFDAANRRIGFSLGENITNKLNINTENALWVDGTLTPLPPVRITDAGTDQSELVIQDLEGMVDLSFRLAENLDTSFDVLLMRLRHQNLTGYFTGMVMTRDGEQLPVRNLWGTVEKFLFKL